MARVQLFEGGNVAPAQATDARLQPANFGPGIGEGVTRLGEALGQAAEVSQGISAMHDEAAVKEATNSINQWYTQAAYTGPDAYFPKQGKNALEGKPFIDKGLSEIVKQHRAMLQNPRQQFLFDKAVQPQQLEWSQQISEHAAKETLSYNVDESVSRAATVGELARQSYVQSPQEAEQHISTGLAEVENAFKLKGAGPETIASEKLKYSSGIYRDVGSNLSTAGADGPALAQAFADKHRDSMTGDDYQHVLDRATTEQHALEAETRRAEAEQRRADHEAKQDARSRVESALGLLSDGVPLKSEDYTNVIEDAKATGDPLLVKRVADGQFKNGLALQWNDASPVDLQNHLNEVSARIAKSGASAKPEDMVERDTLTSILDNSRAELNRDPISWGARHLGIPVQPLNLDDQGSINLRLSQTALVTRRTGHAPLPLTGDEAATFTSQLSQATTSQQVALVTKVARFGPLAQTAAGQITNNTGFINLVGLASLNNRGVAASRVNQVVTGYDVLKTKPKLIDKNDSAQQFNQYVGGALQFLPKVSDGVYSNASALLGAEANQHGWSEWGQIDNRAWYRAVNSALGAYTTPKGEQAGGLYGFNGGVTVLPEDMTGAEFETRISKASGPAFAKAANGDPVYASGQMPSATDLKRMQWVPSGDGVYRLTDGHGFLHTKQGGFYEIDANKLTPVGGGPRLPFGMISPGNIDLHHRTIVHNSDGSISTVRSISVGTDVGEVLIPTVVKGRVVSNAAALQHYKQTGEHLGIFKTPAAATAYAKSLHEQQAREYGDFNAAHGYSRH